MGAVQLRRYELQPGSSAEFVAAWEGARVLREQYGFTVLLAVVDEEHDEFVWAITHDGDFADAERAYYASPERAALPVDPARFIAQAHVAMVRPEVLPN